MNNIVKSIYVPENDLWGLPQTYKGVQFYPLKIKETHYIDLMYKIFAYPKNYIPDKQILKMSYLKFVLYIIQMGINKDGNEIYTRIINFLKYVTQNDKVEITYALDGDGEEPTIENILLKIKIGETEFSEDDFDALREIVLEQNGIGIEYIEQYHPELEKKLEESIRSSKDRTTFVDEVLIFCALMFKMPSEVQDYTLFQFKNQFGHIMVLKDFDLYKPLETSGQITLPKGTEINHYLSGLKKAGRYDSILVRKDTYVQNNDIFKL